MSEASLDPAEFLEHAGFVRRLALRLAVDEAAAEDLVQDTWLAALQRPPARGPGVRAWLARVLRNQAALRLRRGERRERRERTVAREERAPDTALLIERMELHARVVEEMLALPEPYRETVVRRFARDERPAEIAGHLGLPEATVRTRLRRGLERLREKLRESCDGSPALLVASLRGLAEGGASAAAPGGFPPTAAGVPLEPFLVLAMKKATLLVGGAAALLLVAWSVSRLVSDAPQAPPGERQVVASAPAELAEAERPSPADPGEPAEPERVALAAPAAEPEQAPAAAPVAEAADPEARAWLRFRVEDGYGNPVPQAEIQLTMFRTHQAPGSSYGWGEEASTAITGPDGVAELWHRVHFPDPDVGLMDVSAVGFTVSHPDYTTYREWDQSVDEELVVVVLQRGSFLIVSGWIDAPDERVVDVVPLLDDDVMVTGEEWLTIADGRLSCAKIPPGEHALVLRHDDESGPWSSEVVRFSLAEGEHKELHLQLHPPAGLFGVLDEAVPRPVRDGEAWLCLYLFDQEAGVRIFRRFETAIAADGSFAFTGLPPGTGEVIAMCEGFASTYVERPGAEPDAPPDGLQQVDPAATSSEAPFVLDMTPAARVELTVLDEDGAPIPGAMISSWPNVHWTLGYSQIFLERSWHARTDANGRATLENLPANEDGFTFYGIVADGYRMPLRPDRWGGEDTRDGWLELRPGETLEEVVRMEAWQE